jgi:4-oxalocrotonate tautomerase
MPFVIVEMWEGRTPEQKKQLAKDITEAFVKNNVPAEAVQIILRDNPKNSWCQAGKMASDK